MPPGLYKWGSLHKGCGKNFKLAIVPQVLIVLGKPGTQGVTQVPHLKFWGFFPKAFCEVAHACWWHWKSLRQHSRGLLYSLCLDQTRNAVARSWIIFPVQLWRIEWEHMWGKITFVNHWMSWDIVLSLLLPTVREHMVEAVNIPLSKVLTLQYPPKYSNQVPIYVRIQDWRYEPTCCNSEESLALFLENSRRLYTTYMIGKWDR